MAGLAVKVDQVAALRAVRKSQSPDPVTAATVADLAGADGIIVHLRQDRKHIKDRDVRILRSVVQSKLILEMASTTEMVGVALDIKPDLVTLVPEKREQFTSDGGLDLIMHRDDIAETVATLQNSGIPVGLLVDPQPEQIKMAHGSNAGMIEGLCYKTIKAFKGIHEIDEFSIGHSIISRALMTGMRDAVEEMVRLIRAL